MPRRLFIVHNPVAGVKGTRRLHQVIDRLGQLGCEHELHSAESFADNQRMARAAAVSGDFDAVVAAGGDGTIRATASVLMTSATPLGIIPIGTGNVMAHEIGLRRQPDAIANCLAQGEVATVQAGYANGQPFFLMVGAGFDGRVARLLDLPYKRRVGRMAYAWPIIRALISGPDKLRVCVDGVEYEAAWAIATLRRRYAGAFVLAPQVELGGTGIHAVLFKPAGRLAMLSQLLEVAAGRIERRPDVQHLSGTRIEISSDLPVPVQIDGEPSGVTPVDIETRGAALKLIVPPA